jgi:hypothetical protein
MRAAEVIDRVRKMKTAEHLLIAGRDNPTEDYGPGILNCLGNVRFICYIPARLNLSPTILK